jgi:hypothetical protein
VVSSLLSKQLFLAGLRSFVVLARLDPFLCHRAAVLEAVGLVARFNDMAMMREPIQQCRGQFRITEYSAPFREGQVRGDDDAGSETMI